MELTPAARRLRAALAAVLVPAHALELALVRRWLDSWSGLGLVTAGMARQGWDLQLTAYGDGHWRATFYVTGMVHSIAGGSAWEPTPWGAVQRAAWEAVKRTHAHQTASIIRRATCTRQRRWRRQQVGGHRSAGSRLHRTTS